MFLQWVRQLVLNEIARDAYYTVAFRYNCEPGTFSAHLDALLPDLRRWASCSQIRFQPIPVASPVASQLKPSFESVWLLATEIGQAKGDIKTVYPGSDSMAPTIRPWHRMVTMKVQQKNLQIGDIIVVYQWQPFRYGGRELVLVGHRIVEIGNDEQGWWAVTKGDNNDWPDETLRRGDEICCKVIAVLY